jgi:hypothetical protein
MKRSLLVALAMFGAATAFALTPTLVDTAVLLTPAKGATAEMPAVSVPRCICGDRSADGTGCICRGTERCSEKCAGDCGKCPGRGEGCPGPCQDKCQGPCKDKCQGPCADKCQGPCQGKCGGPCGDKAAKAKGCPNRGACKRAA